MLKNSFANLQRVGKALMLPVSVLPVAGILLGVGAANFSWLPEIVSHLMEQGRWFSIRPDGIIVCGGGIFGLYQQRWCVRFIGHRRIRYYGRYP